MLKEDETILFTIPEIMLTVHYTKEEDKDVNYGEEGIGDRSPDFRTPSGVYLGRLGMSTKMGKGQAREGNFHGYRIDDKRKLVVTNKRFLFSEIKSKDKIIDYFCFDEKENDFFLKQYNDWAKDRSSKQQGLKGYASTLAETYKTFAKGFTNPRSMHGTLPHYWGLVLNPTFTVKEKKKGFLGRGGTEIDSAEIQFFIDFGGKRECNVSCDKEYANDLERISKVVGGS